jgi:hypothetical protein
MASTDARLFPIKNTAFRVTFPIFDADGDLVTGAAGLDSEISKDGGTFTDCTNEATEIATNSGMYYLDVTATEGNADCVAIIVKTTTSGAKTTPMVFYPVTLSVAQLGINAVQAGGTVLTGRDLGASVLLSNGTGTGQISLSSGAVLLQAIQTGVTIPTVTNLTNAASNGDLTATMKASVTAAVPSATANASAARTELSTELGRIDVAVSTRSTHSVADIFAALTSGLSTIGSIGKLIVDNLNATVSSRSTYAGNDTSGTTTLLQRIIGTLASGTHNAQSGDAYARIGANGASLTALATQASVHTIDDFIDTEITAIKDVIDKLNTALELDGAVYRFTLNALELAPTGGSAPTVAQIREEIDANSTRLAEIVADTNELQTDNVPGLIAGLNNLSSAQAQNAAAAALTAYDPPTKAEMDLAVSGITAGSGATPAEIDAYLSAEHGAGPWGGAAGDGAVEHTVNVDDGSDPLDGVNVWVTSDVDGTSIVARGYSDALGKVVFMLDVGTYYLWKQLAGYSFTNPETFTVVA